MDGDMMFNNDETKVYSTDEIKEAYLLDELKDIYHILKERGYNPINQIVGYLISGDLGYITSYKDARKRIMQFERINIIEALVKNSIEL